MTVRWILVLVALLGPVAALAAPFAEVRETLGPGVWINWTQLRVEVVVGHRDPGLAGDAKPLEQRAIREINDRIESIVKRVPLSSDRRVGEAAEVVTTRVQSSWQVAESRYFASGRVEVLGVAALQEVLAPWNLDRSLPAPADLADQPTGLVVDARGVSVAPTWAPRLGAPDGSTLYDGRLWTHLAFERAPAAWVSDPAAPQAGIAGASPLFVRVAEVRDGVMVLDEASADQVRTSLLGSSALGAGRVVVVVDAPVVDTLWGQL